MGEITELNVTLPASPEELRENVRHALSLGLPDVAIAGIEKPHALRVFASGPSARAAPFMGSHAPFLAVNGALALFTEPTYWAACDPQALVADNFLAAHLPEETTYLVASQCHPRVFERLAHRRVALWHMNDDDYADLVADKPTIACMGSISVMSIWGLAPMLGYNRVETWGWDGCFFGQRHHVSDQDHAVEEVTNDILGETFRTTKTWIFEMICARAAANLSGVSVRVGGSGMFGAVLRADEANRNNLRAA